MMCFGMFWATLGQAQPSPVGDQFQVNTYTTNIQSDSSVALSSDGFVVVWTSLGSGSDAYSTSVQLQRFDSAGISRGVETQINSYTIGGQDNPDIALNSSGEFVVAWQSNGSPSDSDSQSIQLQHSSLSSFLLGSDIQANT